MLSTFHLLFLPIFHSLSRPQKTIYKRWKSGASDYHTTRSSYSTCLPSYKADTETRTLNLLITNQTHNRLCYISVYLFILHSQYKKSLATEVTRPFIELPFYWQNLYLGGLGLCYLVQTATPSFT